MTPAQLKSFYFPAWRECCQANFWHMVKGRLSAQRQPRFHDPEVDRLYQTVWSVAEQLARRHRSVTADDLRHGCHIVAIGRDKSSIRLENDECDHVVALFAVLENPDDLNARLRYQHHKQCGDHCTAPPDTCGRRKRLIYSISQLADEPYIEKICRDRKDFSGLYEWPHWQALPRFALSQLARTLRSRKQSREAREASETATA